LWTIWLTHDWCPLASLLNLQHPAESLSFLLLAKDGGEDKSHKDRDDRERKDRWECVRIVI
jgi:hypothetical protein